MNPSNVLAHRAYVLGKGHRHVPGGILLSVTPLPCCLSRGETHSTEMMMMMMTVIIILAGLVATQWKGHEVRMMSGALAFENLMGLERASRDCRGLCSPGFVCDRLLKPRAEGRRNRLYGGDKGWRKRCSSKAAELRGCCSSPCSWESLWRWVLSLARCGWAGTGQRCGVDLQLRHQQPRSRRAAVPGPAERVCYIRDPGSWKMMFQSCETRTEKSCEERVASV